MISTARIRVRRSREWTAFLIVPLAATLSWYVAILVVLAIGNGRLRWRTDVLAMALGAMIVGLPTSTIVTLVLAVPAYWVARRTVGVSLVSAAIAGGTIGLGAALAFWMLAREWTALSPVRGLLIGVATATVWWYAAGRPGSPSSREVDSPTGCRTSAKSNSPGLPPVS
jgi:hypothetical protein